MGRYSLDGYKKVDGGNGGIEGGGGDDGTAGE